MVIIEAGCFGMLRLKFCSATTSFLTPPARRCLYSLVALRISNNICDIDETPIFARLIQVAGNLLSWFDFLHGRSHAAADIHHKRTTQLKDATRRWITGVMCDAFGDLERLAFFQGWHRLDQDLRIWMLGIGKDVSDRGDFNDFSGVHH